MKDINNFKVPNDVRRLIAMQNLGIKEEDLDVFKFKFANNVSL
jgi:hypothetical protein